MELRPGNVSMEKNYCRICGKSLVIDKTVTGYDEMTGVPTMPYIDQKQCPNSSCRSILIATYYESRYPHPGWGVVGQNGYGGQCSNGVWNPK